MRPIRLALVGFGKWGRNYVRAARDSGEAEVTRIVTHGHARPEDVGAPHVWVDRMADAAPAVDAFVIAAHPAFAQPHCQVALEYGLPVLCEKPAGLSLGEAQAIARAEAASKSFVLVGHQHLFAEGFDAVVDWRRHNPGTGHADWRGPGPTRDYSALWDYGPHAVSALLGLRHMEPWWRPDPFLEHIEADDDKATLIWFMGTERVQARMSRVHDRKEARVYFWDESTRAEHGPCYDAYAPAEPPLTRQVRAFARAVRAGGTDDYRFGARWAVDVARILEMASAAV